MDGVKVTVHDESPSAQVVASSAEVVVTASGGMKITLKKPGVLAQFKLVELLGESASNTAFVSMCLPLIFVTAIDGDPVSRITTRVALDGLIARLDEEGVGAVAQGVYQHFGKPNPEADRAAIKN